MQLSEAVTPPSTSGRTAWQLASAERMIPAGQVTVGRDVSTVNMPVPVAKSVGCVATTARTVKLVTPPGVELVVDIVNVDVFEVVPVGKVRELGKKDPVAPGGKGVMRLKFAVKFKPLVPLVTITV